MNDKDKTYFTVILTKKLNRDGAAKTLRRPIPSVGGEKGGQA